MTATVAARLHARQVTPIAQLNPDLPNRETHILKGEITLTWPYNSLKRSLAFLLAESDIRLRRSKGQVRVELGGSSAAAVAEHGLGGGDEILVSLEGAEWAKDDTPVSPPGSRVEWQLQYRERIFLQV